MMLEATELGLGSVWICYFKPDVIKCYFKPDVIKEEFNLPDNLEPVNILAIGYSDEKPASLTRHEETRMPLSDLIYYCK